MHVSSELLTCPLPRNTSLAGLFLNFKPLSSWKQMAIFLNQLCREMFPSSPNKQGISNLLSSTSELFWPKANDSLKLLYFEAKQSKGQVLIPCCRNVSGKKFQQLHMDQGFSYGENS